MNRFLNTAALCAALVMPILMTPAALRADDHKEGAKYHDKAHNDDHEWSSHEDQAYRMWVKQSHRKYGDFAKLKESDQQAYWGWRHDHSDAMLKIEIH